MKSPGAPVLAGGVAHILAWGIALLLAFLPVYEGASATAVSAVAVEVDRRSTGPLPLDAGAISTLPADVGESVRSTATLIQVNGLWVLGLLVIPIVLTGLVLISTMMRQPGRAAARRYRWRLVGWVAALVLLALSIVGSASVGLFYLPVALLTLVAAALRTRPSVEGGA